MNSRYSYRAPNGFLGAPARRITVAAIHPLTKVANFSITFSQIDEFFSKLGYKSFVFGDRGLSQVNISDQEVDYFFIPGEKAGNL